MTSLSFPDLNVWHAAATADHVHHSLARGWFEQETGSICFTRITQLGFLRLTTTAAAMDGKPLTMAAAWRAYDWFLEDPRITFFPDPPGAEMKFRNATSGEGYRPSFGPMPAC